MCIAWQKGLKVIFNISKQYDDFIAELAILCNKHNLQIVTSQYETIQVWIKDKNEPIECFEDKFEDKTELKVK